MLDLGRLHVGLVVNRVDLDPGLVLPLVVRDLVEEGGKLVDRQARTTLKLAHASDLIRPLLALQKLQVVEGVRAVLGLRADTSFKELDDLPDQGFIVFPGCLLVVHQQAWAIGVLRMRGVAPGMRAMRSGSAWIGPKPKWVAYHSASCSLLMSGSAKG